MTKRKENAAAQSTKTKAPTVKKEKALEKQKTGKGYRSYTPEFRMKTLHLLEQSGMAFTATARDAGITINTLRNWYNKYGYELTNPSVQESTAIRTGKELAEKNEDLYEKVYEAKDVILDRIIELASKSKSLPALTNILETLANLDGTFKGKGGEEDKGKKTMLSVYGFIEQQSRNQEPIQDATVISESQGDSKE